MNEQEIKQKAAHILAKCPELYDAMNAAAQHAPKDLDPGEDEMQEYHTLCNELRSQWDCQRCPEDKEKRLASWCSIYSVLIVCDDPTFSVDAEDLANRISSEAGYCIDCTPHPSTDMPHMHVNWKNDGVNAVYVWDADNLTGSELIQLKQMQGAFIIGLSHKTPTAYPFGKVIDMRITQEHTKPVPPRSPGRPPKPAADSVEKVTLRQVADDLANRSKSCIEKWYREDPVFPKPYEKPFPGQALQFVKQDILDYLEKKRHKKAP